MLHSTDCWLTSLVLLLQQDKFSLELLFIWRKRWSAEQNLDKISVSRVLLSCAQPVVMVCMDIMLNKLGLSCAKLRLCSVLHIRMSSCQFDLLISLLPTILWLFEVVFLWSCLYLILSLFEVVFLWSHLLFQWDFLPERLSFCQVDFHTRSSLQRSTTRT